MSKPTPNNATKKTASAPKGLLACALFLLLSVVVLGAVLWLGRGPQIDTMRVHGKSYVLDVSETNAARDKGLGGRASMAQNAGMLFVFPTPARQCFWMKGMHFPLDIIWIDRDKKVVSVRPNLTPSTYPTAFCTNDTQYVIELNAGQAAAAGIQTGIPLDF